MSKKCLNKLKSKGTCNKPPKLQPIYDKEKINAHKTLQVNWSQS